MNIVNQIEIQDSSGAPKGAPVTGDVVLEGGGGFSITVEEGAFVLSSGTVTGDDPYYVQKYKDLVNGGVYPPAAPHDYEFTGWDMDAIYKYINSVNSVIGIDGFLFLLGGGCAQLGLFDDNQHPGGVSGLTPYPAVNPINNLDITEHGLHLFDMCAADVNCQDYSDFYDYMTTVKDWIDNQKHNVESPPETSAINGFGVFDQYISLVSYWNYLVTLLVGRSDVYEGDEDDTYVVEFFYHNAGAATPDSTLTASFSDGTDPVPIVSTEHEFRPTSHGVTVDESGTDPIIYILAADLVPNTQWLTRVTIDVSTITGDTITYSGSWTNVTFEVTTSGQFTV